MPKEMNTEVLRHLAKLGARARLEQIEIERRAILATFPDLARGGGPRRAGGRGVSGAAPAATKRRRRRKMTAAQRKEVSERMKKYWAERRKAKGK